MYVYVVESSPATTKEVGVMGREIESHKGFGC
jgi:hypothetical protein